VRWRIWAGVCGPAARSPPSSRSARCRLAYLHCTALLNVHGTDPQAADEARRILAGIAADADLHIPARLSAAINLIVLHAHSHQPRERLRSWQHTANRLVDEASPDECGRLLMSAYWRAVSFIPFLEGDHGETQDMLGEAERLAHLAVVEAAQANRYVVAAENLGLVLDTRSRAAEAAGDADQALRCCRDSTELDPLDSKALVRLADCLLWTRDVDGARRAYADAAHLGAPYTSYASAQVNRLTEGGAPGEAAYRPHHHRA
jgi:tetratricopeptide (TPR) repeat protein